MHKAHPDTIIVIKSSEGLHESTVSFNNFADGDSHCLINDTEHIYNADILIKHYLYPNQNEQIVRLMLLAGTLKSLGVKSISLFAPYLPYARQDKAHYPGEAIAIELLCRAFHTFGIDTVHTIDCHFMKGAPSTTMEGLHVNNILVQHLLIERVEEIIHSKSYHVIGPDSGSSYLSNGYTMRKSRSNSYTHTENGSISNDVSSLSDKHLSINHSTIVVADDMISTGSTMIKALENLRSRGIKKLYVTTTHGLFLNGSFDTITQLAHVICSDTIPLEDATEVTDTIFADLVTKL